MGERPFIFKVAERGYPPLPIKLNIVKKRRETMLIIAKKSQFIELDSTTLLMYLEQSWFQIKFQQLSQFEASPAI